MAILAITGASIGYGHIYYFWIAIIFGMLGYVMQRGGFALLPLAMALILGPMMERNLRSALMLPAPYISTFLGQPIAVMLSALALVVVIGRLVALWSKQHREGLADRGPLGE